MYIYIYIHTYVICISGGGRATRGSIGTLSACNMLRTLNIELNNHNSLQTYMSVLVVVIILVYRLLLCSVVYVVMYMLLHIVISYVTVSYVNIDITIRKVLQTNHAATTSGWGHAGCAT